MHPTHTYHTLLRMLLRCCALLAFRLPPSGRAVSHGPPYLQTLCVGARASQLTRSSFICPMPALPVYCVPQAPGTLAGKVRGRGRRKGSIPAPPPVPPGAIRVGDLIFSERHLKFLKQFASAPEHEASLLDGYFQAAADAGDSEWRHRQVLSVNF
jgi:hypothetical protein